MALQGTQPITKERWQRIKEIFEAVLETPREQRSSVVAELCHGDLSLCVEVESLLARVEDADSFLERPAIAGLAAEFGARQQIFQVGDRISGRFEIVRFIGQGGMGEVYEAHDWEIDSRVALKTIRPETALHPGMLARFKQEVQLTRRVTHPNVCRTFDVFRHRIQPAGTSAIDVIYLTMELLEGETPAQRLRRGRMTAEEALPLILQMAKGLEAAHVAGVIHRDFKPGNVILCKRPVRAANSEELCAVVTDFGLARSFSLAESLSGSLTTGGAIIGTLSYMSPEQLEGKEATLAADIYSFGFVVYEMLTGVKPFGESVWLNVLRRLTEDPAEPVQHVPDLDPRWNRAILRCLRRDPAERFRSASEIVACITDQSAEHQRGIQPNEAVVLQDYWKHHSPFRSLQVFEPEDAWLFFGRDSETAELMSCLGRAPMLAVVGNSGSGKSSLIRAGLIPALHRGHFHHEGSPVHSWRVAIVRPSASPFDYLAEILPSQLAPELTPTQQLEFIAAGRAQFPGGGDALRNAISALAGSGGKRAVGAYPSRGGSVRRTIHPGSRPGAAAEIY